jgi:ribosomal protein S18 acetylase RimI-like enzyme
MKVLTIERLAAGAGNRFRAIRLRSLRDAPDAFATTYEEAATWASDNWDRQLEQFPTFVASADGVDWGTVRGALHDGVPGTGYLISMWVAPEGRRLGIGSALVDAVVAWARTQGLQRLLLDVSAENTSAIAFYAARGFRPTGEAGTLPPPRQHMREIQLCLTL